MEDERDRADARRKLMSRFRGKNTEPELLVRRALHSAGLRFRLHRRNLPGTPDIVLPRHKLAIFVHGCFWHHHEGCSVGKIPATKSDFWREKFSKNRERDRANEEALVELGWEVKTIWECEARSPGLRDRLRALRIIRAQADREEP